MGLSRIAILLSMVLIFVLGACDLPNASDGTEECKVTQCIELYAPILNVYVARGDNFFGTDISVEHVYELITGFGHRSVNPIMLQADIVFLRSNVTVYNILLESEREEQLKQSERTRGDFANDILFLGRVRLKESDIDGNHTGNWLNVDPVAHHALLSASPSGGGYTGGALSGVLCNGCTRNVLAHEFGHMVGLGHYSGSDNRLMSPVIYDNDVVISPVERDIVAKYIQNSYIEPDVAYFRPAFRLTEGQKERIRSRMTRAYVGYNQISKEQYNSALSLVPDNRSFWDANTDLDSY